ncbi:MAG TPA: site-2 protease family protein [Solirubrobacterales bacterium]|nr:site-2 protease family protein [Solirubrobacterales bacterium]
MNWLLIFLGFSALIILHEAGHFFAAKATGMRVERFFLFFPPKLVSIKRGETEYGIGAIPAGGFVKISGMNPDEVLPEGEEHRGYYQQPVWKRIVVIGAGPAVNIVLAFAILFVLALGASDPTQTVDEVVPGSPAAVVLKPGDRIVAIDGKSYAGLATTERLERFYADVGSHKCAGRPVDGCRAATPVVLKVERNGQLQTISVKPEYEKSAGRTRIGFSYGIEPADLSIGGAVAWAGDKVWLVSSQTVTVFARLFEEDRRKEVSGVVGVSSVANEKIDVSTEQALFLLAIVSLSLGLINLFPFLPLDGGHIFWSLVEKVRGKPVPYRVMERAGALGFVLVIMLFFLGLTNDIGRLTGEGFDVR